MLLCEFGRFFHPTRTLSYLRPIDKCRRHAPSTNIIAGDMHIHMRRILPGPSARRVDVYTFISTSSSSILAQYLYGGHRINDSTTPHRAHGRFTLGLTRGRCCCQTRDVLLSMAYSLRFCIISHTRPCMVLIIFACSRGAEHFAPLTPDT